MRDGDDDSAGGRQLKSVEATETSDARGHGRALKLAATLVVTAACGAYVVWKIDFSQTVHVLRTASLPHFLTAATIMIATTWPMAWRWQRLLAAKGVSEGVGWLTRSYFVSYAAGHVLPTSIGGDATRIYETARRHPGRTGLVAGSVLLDRGLAGASTLVLAAFGFALALGHYDVGPYLWLELVLVLAAILLAVVLFSTRIRGPLRRLGSLLARLRLERPLRAVYKGVHSYRAEGKLLFGLLLATVVVQAVRVLSIWLTAESVDIDLPVRVYYVMGPLVTLVLLFPFTLNGLAVREAFFVSFLANFAVGADRAFAAGVLYFAVALTMAVPGALILGWEGIRALTRPTLRDGVGRRQPTASETGPRR